MRDFHLLQRGLTPPESMYKSRDDSASNMTVRKKRWIFWWAYTKDKTKATPLLEIE